MLTDNTQTNCECVFNYYSFVYSFLHTFSSTTLHNIRPLFITSTPHPNHTTSHLTTYHQTICTPQHMHTTSHLISPLLTTPHHTSLQHTHFTTPRFTTPHHTSSHYTHFTTPHHTTPHHTSPHHTTLHHR